MKKLFKTLMLFALIITFTISSMNVYAAGSLKKAATATLKTPTITQNIETETEGSVEVTISDWGTSEIKEYKIDNDVWKNYVEPIVLKLNSTVYARGRNSSGTVSKLAILEVKNINRLLNKVEVSKQSKSTVKVVEYDINDNEIGSGSGFIVSSDGKVVTNYHVIDMVPKLKVIASDSKTYDVLGVLAYEASRDIAILQLDKVEYLPAVKLGDSDDLELGEDIVAIGNPLGLQTTVSFGNISSLNTPGGLRRTTRKDIQITAPISSGSSGGPLFNMYGEVVGINYSTIKDSQNLNYSIPINELKLMLASKTIKKLADVIKEVYPTMTYSEYEDYLYCNYPDSVSNEYTFSFTYFQIIQPSKYPNELDVYLSLNPQKYGEILLAEKDGNKNEVEKWIDDIYKCVKAKFPDKDIYVIVALECNSNARLAGYTDKEVSYNSTTKKWHIRRYKIVYGNKNNVLSFEWAK